MMLMLYWWWWFVVLMMLIMLSCIDDDVVLIRWWWWWCVVLMMLSVWAPDEVCGWQECCCMETSLDGKWLDWTETSQSHNTWSVSYAGLLDSVSRNLTVSWYQTFHYTHNDLFSVNLTIMGSTFYSFLLFCVWLRIILGSKFSLGL